MTDDNQKVTICSINGRYHGLIGECMFKVNAKGTSPNSASNVKRIN